MYKTYMIRREEIEHETWTKRWRQRIKSRDRTAEDIIQGI
jgi:hypothetical protein